MTLISKIEVVVLQTFHSLMKTITYQLNPRFLKFQNQKKLKQIDYHLIAYDLVFNVKSLCNSF